MTWRIGVDIGGAFTDLYAVESEKGETAWTKVESTPPEFEKGVLEGIEKLEEQGIDLNDASQIIHGQTVVINTIITRDGSNVGFITTKGYDIMDIQRANRRDIFNFRYKKPEQFINRYMTEWVTERTDEDGSIHQELNEEDVRKAAESLIKKGAEAISIGFINSYQNPEHERRAREIVEDVYEERGIDDPFITISSDTTQEWREYERFNTAILNAYVQPTFVNYIEKLEEALKTEGFDGTFYLTLASGGMATAKYAKKFPITTIEGGPISGIMGGTSLGEVLEEEDIIIIDGGSTTTKAGLAENLTPKTKTEYWLEQDEYNPGYPVKVPVVDIQEIGNGGTSIVWVDKAGNLQVGPEAAGARPGPVCYGMGGDKPTLTDAYVVTGHLNPEYLLGGELEIDKGLAEGSLKRVSDEVDLSLQDTAYGAIRVANDNSSRLIRLISIRKGLDPREFTLIAHGGSGPMYAPFIAQDLDIPEIIVPAIPSGVFNPWGMVGLDIRHELVKTRVSNVETDEEDIDIMNSTFEELEKEIAEAFEEEGISEEETILNRRGDIKYEGQAHTLKIPIPNGELTKEEINDLKTRFHDAHDREYGFRLSNSEIKIVNYHTIGLVKVEPPKIEKHEGNDNSVEDALIEKRMVYDGKENVETPVYDKDEFPIGKVAEGPCILEGATATTIVPKGFKVKHDVFGNLVMKH
ncbi:MAG: hydantoinase/oxoprolinase family protein [Thermoplasmata archaeon]